MTDLINKYFEETLETEEKINIEYVIGIDLGTCNSCCSIWRNNAAEVIPDEYGNRTIPSVVSFTNKTVYIGVEARNQLLLAPKNAYYEIKRLIGKKMNDKTVLGDKKFLTYELRADKNDNVAIVYEKDGNEKLLSPEELSSYILMKLKKMASDYLKSPVSKAVISVPAYFNDAQRQATRDAATIAGLECIRIISEPVASALAYGLNKLTKISREGDTYVVVYDLGGGTLDVSLLTINDGIFEVIGSAGNTHLGGVDFDNRIFEYCINVFKTNHINFDETIITAEASQKLRKACENAKKVLSSTAQTTIGVINFFNGENLIVNLTRTKFNDICNDLRMLCLQPLSDILLNCEIKKEAINEIILVGGMTRVPSIREDIQRFFNKCPNSSINPDEIVSVGAAIQGHILVHKNDPFSDSITLLDTTALSLGIETIGGVMSIMIPRGTIIPCYEKKTFTNDTSNETSVMIKVYEGERKLTRDNFYVGEFELSGLSSAPRGYHKIEVTFSVDMDGMIIVSAEDLRRNNVNTIRINGNRGRLSTDEIDKLVENAKNFEENDKLIKKKKRMHHELSGLCENIIKNLDFRETKLPEQEMKDIKDDVNQILELLKNKYDEIDDEIYTREIKRLKANYCILITQIDDENINKKICYEQTKTNGTSVFQNEDDEEKTYVKIVANEFGYDENVNEDILNELRRTRDLLIETCHNTLEILGHMDVFLHETIKNEIKDYIEDVLIWIHVQQKISLNEYQQKMNELTEMCNRYIEYLPEEKNSRNELITLCTSLQNCLSSNMIAIDEDNMHNLDTKLNEILQWIDTTQNATDDEYNTKIDEINEMCNSITSSLVTDESVEKIEIMKS
jgi:heat shock 70kDa protein 1/2/6/8